MAVIRSALLSDAPAIETLLSDLGYPGTGGFIKERIQQLLAHSDEELLVAEEENKILGVISLHFIPQLALAGDFCRISYFCVDAAARGRGIGNLLESRGQELARARHCDRIEVHCHARRINAHRFYERQGYVESPKYFCKSLNSNS